jgi:alginate O-acetyltransferase complex protein AlgI
VFFNSIEYAVFLPVVLVLYWSLGRRGQNVVLLVASYVFYGWWDYRFLGLLALSTLIDFAVGRGLGRYQDELTRRWLLMVSLVANLGLLAAFKYFNFFADSAAALVRGLGLEANPTFLRVVLPVGISFYTFQTISYSFDVYRRRIEPTKSLLDFAVFVAFFPQLVAGPIERAGRLLPQITSSRVRPSSEQVWSALTLILIGLFKKVAIADVMAPFVDQTFSSASTAGAIQLIAGAYAFGLQIYGDFSGYSSIARGSSRLLGIELMRNFEQPYLSRNITEFWRTWHVSLSSWLHDYLYVPLGGNRGSRLATYRNLMITMLLGGLWHGAAWTFVIWGGLHGVFLSVHRRFGRHVSRGYQGRFTLRDLLPALLTFNLVSFAWVFFRADSLGEALRYVQGIVTLRGGSPAADSMALLLIAGLSVFVLDIAQRNSGQHSVVVHWRPVARGMAYAAMVLAIVGFAGGETTPFIYFQF